MVKQHGRSAGPLQNFGQRPLPVDAVVIHMCSSEHQTRVTLSPSSLIHICYQTLSVADCSHIKIDKIIIHSYAFFSSIINNL